MDSNLPSHQDRFRVVESQEVQGQSLNSPCRALQNLGLVVLRLEHTPDSPKVYWKFSKAKVGLRVCVWSKFIVSPTVVVVGGDMCSAGGVW